MSFWDLLFTASVPSLEVLIVTGLGTFIASDFVGILSEEARSFMNRIVFYVFNPSLVGSNLADTITAQSLVEMWFMPINILITFLCGSALGWILIKVTRAPSHLKALIMGICSAGNVGNLMIIIVPAICGEPGSPFGNEETCSSNGLAYASLSMAIGAIYIWTYVYNIMRVSSLTPPPANINGSRTYLEFAGVSFAGEPPEVLDEGQTEALLPYRSDENVKEELQGLRMFSYAGYIIPASLEQFVYKLNAKKFYVPLRVKCVEWLKIFAEKINLKNIFAPSTCGAIAGFFVGLVPPVRKLLIGDSAPLQVITKSASLVGEGAVPTITLIIGGNLLSGLKGSGLKKRIIAGVLIVRFLFLPVFGIGVVKAAIRAGFVKSEAQYQFVLMLQYAVPPANNISTIAQLFKSGENECAVFMLWTYAFAAFGITIWATLYMILVS